MEHTKAPWSHLGWIITGGDGSTVARIVPWDSSGTRDEDIANARLIAAAPDLLEALEGMIIALRKQARLAHVAGGDVYLSEDNGDVWIKARAAIAKAKGETNE
jgi:hypothetical protein